MTNISKINFGRSIRNMMKTFIKAKTVNPANAEDNFMQTIFFFGTNTCNDHADYAISVISEYSNLR